VPDSLTAAPHSPGSTGARLSSLSAEIATEWALGFNGLARALGITRPSAAPVTAEVEILHRLAELVAEGRTPAEAGEVARAVLGHNLANAKAARKPHFAGAKSWGVGRWKESFDRLGQASKPSATGVRFFEAGATDEYTDEGEIEL
jgi:hypothetical protein